SLRSLRREGFRTVFTLNEAQSAAAQIERVPLWTDRRNERGPFDIIGDVHGCHDELTELLARLGYAPETGAGGQGPADGDGAARRRDARALPAAVWKHPEGRRAVFIGDLVDRGPKVVETVRLAMAMVADGSALCVPGNHDVKLMRALKGNPVTIAYGL